MQARGAHRVAGLCGVGSVEETRAVRRLRTDEIDCRAFASALASRGVTANHAPMPSARPSAHAASTLPPTYSILVFCTLLDMFLPSLYFQQQMGGNRGAKLMTVADRVAQLARFWRMRSLRRWADLEFDALPLAIDRSARPCPGNKRTALEDISCKRPDILGGGSHGRG